MATQSWSFGVDHGNDAGFRAWGTDFNAKLAAIGLSQTADTGQINWGSVARPGTNTMAGYEIWEFGDSLQATAPIFLKFEYGTDAEANRPQIWVSIGTGSDGSGSLTGTLVTQIEISSGDGNATGSGFQSFFCHTEGFLGLVWGRDGPETNLNWATFMLCRTCDASGDMTGDGAFYMFQNAPTGFSTTTGGGSSAAHGSINFATSTRYGHQTSPSSQPPCCIIPGNISSTADSNGDIAAYILWGAKPHPFPVIGLACVLDVDVSPTGTFNAALVGATSHTYISVGKGFNASPAAAFASGADISLCMLWE